MTHRYIKIAATSVVLVLAFAGLLWSTLREGTEYYKHVDEVIPQRQTWEGKRLQLHGFVVPGSIFVKQDTLDYRFKVQSKGVVVGARRRSRRLVESGIGAFYLVAALMSVASAVMINAFLTGDYAIRYVQHYSDSVQPLFYKITSYWGGLDGSIMFWVFLLSVFGSIAIYVNRERHRELIPYVVSVIAVVEMFFLFLMIIHKNPFETFLTEAPADGRGLNPLLQNGYMAIHPPSLSTGFVGMTIPYAFGMAALITGRLDDAWLRAVRRWTMFAWIFL